MIGRPQLYFYGLNPSVGTGGLLPALLLYFLTCLAFFLSFSISSFSVDISLSLVYSFKMDSPSSHMSTTFVPYRIVDTLPSLMLCSLSHMRRSFLFLSSSSVKYLIIVSVYMRFIPSFYSKRPCISRIYWSKTVKSYVDFSTSIVFSRSYRYVSSSYLRNYSTSFSSTSRLWVEERSTDELSPRSFARFWAWLDSIEILAGFANYCCCNCSLS